MGDQSELTPTRDSAGTSTTLSVWAKEMVFDHFVSVAMGKLPTDLTFTRLVKIKASLLASWEYDQELKRHGMTGQSIYRLRDEKPDLYNHLRGNFWSMCLDEWYKVAKAREMEQERY